MSDEEREQLRTLDAFLAQCVSDCIEARIYPAPKCQDCDGLGMIVTHICRDDAECKRMGARCPVQEPCMNCLGTGRLS